MKVVLVELDGFGASARPRLAARAESLRQFLRIDEICASISCLNISDLTRKRPPLSTNFPQRHLIKNESFRSIVPALLLIALVPLYFHHGLIIING